jgi:hypothetical protein
LKKFGRKYFIFCSDGIREIFLEKFFENFKEKNLINGKKVARIGA